MKKIKYTIFILFFGFTGICAADAAPCGQNKEATYHYGFPKKDTCVCLCKDTTSMSTQQNGSPTTQASDSACKTFCVL